MSKPKCYAAAWLVRRGAIVVTDLNASCAPCPFHWWYHHHTYNGKMQCVATYPLGT